MVTMVNPSLSIHPVPLPGIPEPPSEAPPEEAPEPPPPPEETPEAPVELPTLDASIRVKSEVNEGELLGILVNNGK